MNLPSNLRLSPSAFGQSYLLFTCVLAKAILSPLTPYLVTLGKLQTACVRAGLSARGNIPALCARLARHELGYPPTAEEEARRAFTLHSVRGNLARSTVFATPPFFYRCDHVG